MKINDLMEKLTEIKKTYGNLDIEIYYEGAEGGRDDWLYITDFQVTPDNEEEMTNGYLTICVDW